MSARPTCPVCRRRPVTAHRNSKYCAQCRAVRRKRPVGNVASWQARLLLRLRGTMTRDELADVVGLSRATVFRFGRDLGLSFRREMYTPELRAEVIAHYEQHGGPATEEAFPNVRVRSIVERNAYEPRQIRWTDAQIVEAARMAGLVSMKRQAKLFNRPNADVGSIKSLWMKRFGMSGGQLHGLSNWMAKEILEPGYPVLQTEFWQTRVPGRRTGKRGLVLWCTMGPYLSPGLPKFMYDAVETMARFQRWLFWSQQPEKVIAKMLAQSRPLRKSA